MLKLALAATATVAAGTTVYLISSHDSPARTSTAAAVAKPQARPSLRLGEGKHGITHTLALGPTAAPREIPSRSIAESDLALLPADSEAVLGLNFGQLQHSALWQRYVAPLISADDVQAFGMKCGFDPVKSLGAITIGVTGITSGSPTGTLVLHGFDRTKALACFEQHATGELEKSGVHVSVDRGVALIDSPDSTQHVGFGFIDDSTAVAVFGPEAATRDAIERVIARAGQHGSSELTEVLQNVNTDASLWVVASQGSPLVGSANGTLAPYTSQRLHTVYMSLDVTDSLALDAGVQLGSPADVAAAIALFTKQIDAIDPDRSLRQRFDQLDVFADGSDLIISAAIAGDQLPMLVGAAMHATLSASIH